MRSVKVDMVGKDLLLSDERLWSRRSVSDIWNNTGSFLTDLKWSNRCGSGASLAAPHTAFIPKSVELCLHLSEDNLEGKVQKICCPIPAGDKNRD